MAGDVSLRRTHVGARVARSGSPHRGTSGIERPAPQPPLTILIVEDNPVDVQLIRWVLDDHELPYDLQVIDNGDRALEVFDQLAQQEHRRSPTIILPTVPHEPGLSTAYENSRAIFSRVSER